MTNDLAIRILSGDILGTTEQTHEAVAMAVKALSALPSADAVEVVRCKDCKYFDSGTDEDGKPFFKCLGWVYGGTSEDDFCSHGERKDGLLYKQASGQVSRHVHESVLPGSEHTR